MGPMDDGSSKMFEVKDCSDKVFSAMGSCRNKLLQYRKEYSSVIERVKSVLGRLIEIAKERVKMLVKLEEVQPSVSKSI